MQQILMINVEHNLIRANIPKYLLGKKCLNSVCIISFPNICPSCCLHSGCLARDSDALSKHLLGVASKQLRLLHMSRGLHHCGKFLEPSDEWAGRGCYCFLMRWHSWVFLAGQEWCRETCRAQIWIFQF